MVNLNVSEARYPSDLSFGSTFGPWYSTDVVTLLQGAEQRNMRWNFALMKGDLRYGIKSLAALQRVLAFFQARQGKAQAYRLKWHIDYQVTNQLLAIGDGSTTLFPFLRWYTNGIADDTYTERLHKIVGINYPIGNPYDSVSVFLNGTPILSGYSVDYVNGVLQLATPPAAGVQISASFEYDWLVRMDTDTLGESLRLVKSLQAQHRVRLGDPHYWPMLDPGGTAWYFWFNIAGQPTSALAPPPAPFDAVLPPGNASMPPPATLPVTWMAVSDETSQVWYLWPDLTGALNSSTTPPAGSGIHYASATPTPLQGPTFLGENTFDRYTLVADSAGEPTAVAQIQQEIAAQFDAIGDVEPIPIVGVRLPWL